MRLLVTLIAFTSFLCSQQDNEINNELVQNLIQVSEIATDKMLAIAPIPGGEGGLVAFHDGGNSEACTSADISSVSYNTVVSISIGHVNIGIIVLCIGNPK